VPPGTSRCATRGSTRRLEGRSPSHADGDRPPGEREAYLKALRRLARRDYSAHDLRTALQRDGFDAQTIDAVVCRLRERRFQDDERYAERFARAALAQRRVGAVRIGCELKARGVARGIVRRALAAAAVENPEGDVLDAQARRYWRSHTRVPAETRLRRLWAHLARRGFTFSVIAERLRALYPELLEEIDTLAAMTTS
jgi:regulatory protein